MKITEKIYDVSTGEISIIERDETTQEQSERLELEAKFEKETQAAAAAAAAKAALLEKLGITEEEAKLLLS